LKSNLDLVETLEQSTKFVVFAKKRIQRFDESRFQGRKVK